MAIHPWKVLQDEGAKVIEATLRSVVGLGADTVADDALFRSRVIDVAWDLLPMPVRLLGRQRLRWDALFFALRASVLDATGGEVRLKADLRGGIASALRGVFGREEPGPVDQPGSPPAPAEDDPGTQDPIASGPEAAVGIDLGTTFSVIAHLDPTGRPWTVANAEGDATTPSVVLFDGDATVVGKEALKSAAMEPDRVAQFAKRDMGGTSYSRTINGQSYPPEVIQSLVLAKLKRDCEDRIGPVRKAVITVPAYFNEPRRRATLDAGRLAGLEVLDIINEPTAAALAFGVQHGFLTAKGESRQAETILVYDLGGGTFDATLMAIDGRDYRALATAGDVFLGGIDWDRRIVDLLAEEFKAKHRGLDPRDHPGGLQRLMGEAEDAKRALSARERATIVFEHAGQGIRVALSRDRFEEMTGDLLERTRFTASRLLREAGLAWGDLTRILLVGGSTRMPMVGRMLERESGRKVDRSLSADESVAHGAAIYAGLLLAHDATALRGMRVRNVNSHALGVLGIETGTGMHRNRVMIPANTPLPASARGRFKTHRQGQSSVAIKVIEGGDASGNNATLLGTCVVRDLPPGLPAGTRIEVEFRYAGNGTLAVEARLPDLGQSACLGIDRASGLTEVQLSGWEARVRDGFRPLNLDA